MAFDDNYLGLPPFFSATDFWQPAGNPAQFPPPPGMPTFGGGFQSPNGVQQRGITAPAQSAVSDPFSVDAGGLTGGGEIGNIADTAGLGSPAGGIDSDKLLKTLGAIKAPPAPPVQAPPRAPDAPSAKTIPGGIQQILALMQGVAGPDPQALRLGQTFGR